MRSIIPATARFPSKNSQIKFTHSYWRADDCKSNYKYRRNNGFFNCCCKIYYDLSNLMFFSVLQSTKISVRADKGKANMQIKEPSEFLKNAIGKNVRVKLNSGFSYKGYFLKKLI